MAQLDFFRTLARPWNTGRIIGPKPPLKPKHIWGIRQQLRVTRRIRDLALFNSAIDSKLRGCDLVSLRVSDVAPGGEAAKLGSVMLTEDTAAAALDDLSLAIARQIEVLSHWDAGIAERLDSYQRETRERAWRKQRFADAMKLADAAWEHRELGKFVEAVVGFEDELSPATVAKLRYARKHSEATGGLNPTSK